jgi:hypothetical protein
MGWTYFTGDQFVIPEMRQHYPGSRQAPTAAFWTAPDSAFGVFGETVGPYKLNRL